MSSSTTHDLAPSDLAARDEPLPRIGPYTLQNRWILAPMAGVSEMPFRVIALELGAALAPTELISAKGLFYKNERTQRYLVRAREERPYSVQLFGGDVESMAVAAEMAVEAGAQIIDINMGCPVKKVTKTGAGSALLCDTTRAAALVKAVAKAGGVPVTCKIRAGWDHASINCVEVAKALQDAGAAAIALHARTRAQGYSGTADWSLIARLREVLTSALLIGNGDVTGPAAAARMRRETGCDMVMIGRAALGNPWIFREMGSDLPYRPSGDERRDLIMRHLGAHIDFVGDPVRAIRQFRQHLIWYSRGLKNGKAFREKVLQTDSRTEIEDLLHAFFTGGASGGDSGAIESLDEGDVNYQIAFG